MHDSKTQPTFDVAILLLEQFAMLAFASTVEPLREANSVAGRRVYVWHVLSHDGQPVCASNGLTLNVDGSIEDVSCCQMVIVVSSFDPQLYITRAVMAWLRRLARQGAAVGAVETGAYVLARARLLDHYRATIHWENMESFVEEFRKVRMTGRIFEIDRKRFTASGAAAAMDMMLHFIAEHLGQQVASAVAEEFIYNGMRGPENPQRLEAAERMNTRHPRMKRLLKMLDSHLEDRLSVAQMAAFERISDREVRRLFQTHLGLSPQTYHRRLRLQKARLMLRQTDLQVADVAVHCGFASGSDFSRAFKREFRQKPLDDRALMARTSRSASARPVNLTSPRPPTLKSPARDRVRGA
jgi:transcriptional regulator GlxA family with amidase domain